MANTNIRRTTTKLESDSFTQDENGGQNEASIYISCAITGCIILISTIYIIICLLMYGSKTGKWKSSRKGLDVNRGMVYTVAVIAISLSIPRYISTQLVIYIQYIPNGMQHCETLLDFGIASGFLSLAAAYIFLWIRQHALYCHPAMKKLAGKYVNYISWATLFVLSGAAIAVLLWFAIPDDYTYSEQGCIVIPVLKNATGNDMSYGVHYVAMLGLLLIAQISLLGLFVYPMIRSSAIRNESLRRTSRKKTVTTSVPKGNETDVIRKASSRVTTRLTSHFKRAKSGNSHKTTVQRTIRRGVVCAAIAITSDIVTMLLAAFAIPSDMSRAVNNTVFDVGHFISGLCILGTFSDCLSVFPIICKARDAPTTNEALCGTENGSGKHCKSDETLSDRLYVQQQKTRTEEQTVATNNSNCPVC